MSQKNKPDDNIRYFNRELSWLAFNRRVLEQANNTKYPVLERLRFLSFVSSNLDQFFEIRVAGLIQQVDSNVEEAGIDGMSPKTQLERVIADSRKLVDDEYECWSKQLLSSLKKKNIIFKTPNSFSRNELKWMANYFEENIYPVLTPMAIDTAHPFPQLINKALNILVWLRNPGDEDRPMMAIIPVPRSLPRVLTMKVKNENRYIFLYEIIRQQAAKLFSGYKIMGAWPFRITRNSDLYIDEEETENLLKKVEEELYKLRKGAAVRLEIEDSVPEEILNELLKSIDLRPEFVFRINGPIDLMRLMDAYEMIDRNDLKFTRFKAYIPNQLSEPANIFKAIAREDIMLHHPYDSFQPVVDFIEQAASDPNVLAIKLTLYRTSGKSPILEALKTASLNGKQVTALIEIKARFDEAKNIQWARELEESGVHVVYGFVGLKTHCKCVLVVRREKSGLKRYAHLGTGNYNHNTAKTYTDLSLFTSRSVMTQDVADLFNTLTGFAREPKFKKILVSPFTFHSTLQRYIIREANHAKAGKPSRVIVKVNSLIDQETINNLYVASQAGVKINLIVRGICGLVPGVKGMSENIRVKSILGRFLEHSRIYYFENGEKDARLYVGSADWMQRNFFRRIEAVFPVESPKLRSYIIDDLLPSFLKDTQNSNVLRANGSYSTVKPTANSSPFGVQMHLVNRAIELQKEDDLQQKELKNKGQV